VTVDARRRKRFKDPSAVETSLFWKSKPRTLGNAASERCESKESNKKENRRIGAMIEVQNRGMRVARNKVPKKWGQRNDDERE
jgi:hypothetical protein